MLNIFLSIITLAVLAIASYTDLKTREVPDWISYGFLFSVIGIRAIFAIRDGVDVLITGILGLIAGALLGMLFYYSHQWGGADTKLLMGVGTVIGITFPFTDRSYTFFFFLLALLFLGAIYSLLWMGYQAYHDRKKFMKVATKLLRKWRLLYYASFAMSGIFVIGGFYVSHLWPFVAFPLGIFFLLLFVNAVEEYKFYKTIDVKYLTEGDWLAGPVKHEGKMIVSSRTVDKNDILRLKREGIKQVKVKEGIPFIPSFLFGYLFILFGGNIIKWLLSLI